MKTRSFKLIKSYPNSQGIGSVWAQEVGEEGSRYWYYGNSLDPADVEDNPEFFEEIIKKGSVLFTTKDGVEIREGDEYFYFPFGIEDMRYWSILVATASSKDSKSCLKFFTRKEADKYLVLNKPCFSLLELDKLASLTEDTFNILYNQIQKTI